MLAALYPFSAGARYPRAVQTAAGAHWQLAVLLAWGFSCANDEPDRQPENQQRSASTPAPAGQPALPKYAVAPGRGANWFCRPVTFFHHKTREAGRLGYCRPELKLCDATPEGPGSRMDTWDSGGGDQTRIVGPCGEFPIAYCYVVEFDASGPRSAHDYRCFMDIVLCNSARAEDPASSGVTPNSDGRATECFASARPLDTK